MRLLNGKLVAPEWVTPSQHPRGLSQVSLLLLNPRWGKYGALAIPHCVCTRSATVSIQPWASYFNSLSLYILSIKQINPISQGCNKVKMKLTCNVPTMISRALQAFNKYRFVELIWKMRWSTVRTNTFKLILWANKIFQHLYVNTGEWKRLKETLFL